MTHAPLENEYEKKTWPQLIMGIDEAGRGPLCGPLSVGCCVLPPFYENPEINDSKKLSEKKREMLYEVITRDALYWKVEMVSPQEIDRLNILEATRQAMTRLGSSYDCVLVLSDAVKLPLSNNIPLIKGDARSISIAAASILAKVQRDRYMKELDRLYPQYELAKHKGYPTKRHLELLETYGIQDFYRRSYAPVRKIIEKG